MPSARASRWTVAELRREACCLVSAVFSRLRPPTIDSCWWAWLRADRYASACLTYNPPTIISTTSNPTRPRRSQRTRRDGVLRELRRRWLDDDRVCVRGGAAV